MDKFKKNESVYYLIKNTLKRVEDILKIEGDFPEEKRKEALKILMDFEYILDEVKNGRL